MSSVWLVESPYYTLQTQQELLWGPRQESWRWDLLDLAGRPISTLDGVSGGRLDFSNATTLRASGTMTYQGSEDVDWLHTLVQPWYQVRFPNGFEIAWPVGVFVPSAPSASHGDDGRSLEVELQSLLLILDQDQIDKTYSLPLGTIVTDAVGWVLDAASMVGGGVRTGTDSFEFTRTAMTWPPGTSRLQIINDLLDSINYFSLSVDGYGRFRYDPYVAPGERGIAWDFVDGSQAIYLSEFTHERDIYSVPNKVIQIAQGSGDTPALVATATNVKPEDPLSFPSRGRWVVHVDEGVEATSQAVLNSIAQRRLNELSEVASVIEIQHWMLPIDINAVVTFKRDPAGISLRGVLQSMSIGCAPGSLCTARIREVTT